MLPFITSSLLSLREYELPPLLLVARGLNYCATRKLPRSQLLLCQTARIDMHFGSDRVLLINYKSVPK